MGKGKHGRADEDPQVQEDRSQQGSTRAKKARRKRLQDEQSGVKLERHKAVLEEAERRRRVAESGEVVKSMPKTGKISGYNSSIRRGGNKIAKVTHHARPLCTSVKPVNQGKSLGAEPARYVDKGTESKIGAPIQEEPRVAFSGESKIGAPIQEAPIVVFSGESKIGAPIQEEPRVASSKAEDAHSRVVQEQEDKDISSVPEGGESKIGASAENKFKVATHKKSQNSEHTAMDALQVGAPKKPEHTRIVLGTVCPVGRDVIQVDTPEKGEPKASGLDDDGFALVSRGKRPNKGSNKGSNKGNSGSRGAPYFVPSARCLGNSAQLFGSWEDGYDRTIPISQKGTTGVKSLSHGDYNPDGKACCSVELRTKLAWDKGIMSESVSTTDTRVMCDDLDEFESVLLELDPSHLTPLLPPGLDMQPTPKGDSSDLGFPKVAALNPGATPFVPKVVQAESKVDKEKSNEATPFVPTITQAESKVDEEKSQVEEEKSNTTPMATSSSSGSRFESEFDSISVEKAPPSLKFAGEDASAVSTEELVPETWEERINDGEDNELDHSH